MTDDQGFGDLGCHGNPVACTPHLDALYAESVRLTDFHVAPMCTPTRGQLLTGLDAARNGAVNVSGGRALLRSDLPTLADHFRSAGYRTGLFGKWHLGDTWPYRPQDRGFDEALWFPSSHINSLPDFWENDYFDDVYQHQGRRERFPGYCTDVFFREAMNWMAAAADRPFLAFLPTNAPHAPLWAPAEDREAMEQIFAEQGHHLPDLSPAERENILRFLAMIRNVDTNVGRLRTFLRERGLDRNTLVIFLTDNGSTFGPLYFNAGMRGAKRSLWEGGHRVPCFWHWPGGGFGPARDIAGLTQVQDILPTLADLCGVPLPATPRDGISLEPVLCGREPVPPDRTLIVNYSRQADTDHPIPDSRAVVRREGAAVLWRRWRLLEGAVLYNLETDPMQEVDVFDRHPDVASHMTKSLDRWWQGVEEAANAVQSLFVGSPRENPVLLTACEWRDVFLDQQRQLRFGEQKNSFWHLEVVRAGRYRFALRRWPQESGRKLQEGCPATRVTDGWLEEGAALPITRARLMVDGDWHSCPVGPGDTEAVFEIPLAAGPKILHTWFDDPRLQPLCGAYHVEVTFLGPSLAIPPGVPQQT